MRKPAAFRQASSTCGAAACSSSKRQRLRVEQPRDRLTMNPACSSRAPASCPRHGQGRRWHRPPRHRCSPETTSTSFISGTGLKKCMPTRRCGCSRPLAMAVTLIDEVLVASTASRRAAGLRARRNRLRLASRFSTMASTTRARPARLRQRGHRHHALHRGARLGIEPALVDQRLQRGRQLLQRLRGRAFAHVEQLDRMAGQRRHLHDAGTRCRRPPPAPRCREDRCSFVQQAFSKSPGAACLRVSSPRRPCPSRARRRAMSRSVATTPSSIAFRPQT